MQTVTTATRIAVTIERSCSRCDLPLEDPASVQEGMGPICRGFANKVLAKELPSAWDADALSAFVLLGVEVFPAAEDRARFEPLYARIVNSKGMNQEGGAVGEDLRAAVKELAYFASAAPSRAVYEAIIGAIRGLGYPEYAAAVNGESASGEASLSFENGRLYLKAVRNAAGRSALRRLGAWFEMRSERWSIDAAGAEDFVRLARLYWPMVTGAEETLAAAKIAPAATPVPAPAPVVVPEPVRSVEQVILQWGHAEFLVSTPYRAAFVAALKALPGGRRWDGGVRAWRVARAHQAQVRALITAHFPGAVVTEQ